MGLLDESPESLDKQSLSRDASSISEKNIYAYTKRFLVIPKIYRYVGSGILLFSMIFTSAWFFVNNNIDTTTHLKSESSIRSSLNIPETAFLERPQIIEKMRKRFIQHKKGIQTIALTGIVGIGGAGKTTMARYFSLKTSHIPIIWELNAENKETLINSLNELAYNLANTNSLKKDLAFIKQIKEPDLQNEQLLNFIKTQLKSASEWILIYDNMESFSQIHCLFPQDPKQWGNGKVIITTRNEHIAETSYIKPENIIHVDELDDKEKLILFSKILYDKEPKQLSNADRDRTIGFLKKIPPFPLDISVAAYSIKNTHVTFEKYLSHIGEYTNTYDHMQTKILEETSNYSSTRYGIISSTIEKIHKINPEFKSLLTFIFFLDSQNIPHQLLEDFKNTKIVDDLIFNLRKNGLLLRESYSEFKSENKVISLHRSTQEIGALFLTSTLTKKEKEYFLGDIVRAIQDFYKTCLENNDFKNITFLMPHLTMLLHNIQNSDLAQEIKNKYEVDLYLIQGYINYKLIKNFNLSKEYFKTTLEKDNGAHLPPFVLVTLLKDLCTISLTMNLLDEGLKYCHKSIDVCKFLPESEIVLADNYQMMGNYYRKKGDFKKAEEFFEKALHSVIEKNSITAKELAAEIYNQLSHLYMMTFLSKKEGAPAEHYGAKALNILNGDQLLHQEFQSLPAHITCNVARHRWKNAEVFMRHHANYDEAMLNLLEAKYIMQQKCPNNMHLKGRALALLGETFLRKNDLLKAEEHLDEGINILDVAAGINMTWTHKVDKAETKIRLEKYKEAFKDCLEILKIGQIERSAMHDLKYYSAFYHAAIANYKLGDYQKSIHYFIEFFKHMNDFCRGYLSDREYTSLKEKDIFTTFPINKDNKNRDIKIYLKNSTSIYESILGREHSFVNDYASKMGKS